MLAGRLSRQRGVTLAEVLVTVAIVALLYSMAAPVYSEWIQNAQIRSSAESALAGLQLARAEGLKRNASDKKVIFQWMSASDATCAASATGPFWVVGLGDVSGKCNDPTDVLRTSAAGQPTPNVTVASAQQALVFDGFGRATLAPVGTAMTTMDFKNPAGGSCVASGGKMRCLRIEVFAGGQIRMCDPAVNSNGDPRKC